MKLHVTDGAVVGFASCFECSVNGAAGVDDDDIAAPQKIRQVAEGGVGDGVTAHARHHQPHAIATETARLWGLVRHEVVWKLEVESMRKRFDGGITECDD